jgi:hypothetical protein
MKLDVKFEGGRARKQAAAPPPFGPAFCPEIVERTETLEIHGSEVSDTGPDYCEFRAINAEGTIIGTKRINGY